MRASLLDVELITQAPALDPLNIPVTMTMPVILLDSMGQSPPSSGPVKESLPVNGLPRTTASSMGSTRLVLVTGLASRLPRTTASSMESAKLVLLILPASTQLVMMHRLVRVSRTVCVTHVPAHLMTQVSLTSVETSWTLEIC